MKKPPNPVETEEGKSKDKGDHLIDGRREKNLLTQRRTEEENQRLVKFKNKNQDSSVPRWDTSDSGVLGVSKL